ncbi:MAG: pyridoxamine 5'-phosphate oxidase family protein [Planctomycetaceae bacterium]|nr:MAG: pyridoxamine 5'-phosphate oxidase family protein [Planctomycetaceae bacterium]
MSLGEYFENVEGIGILSTADAEGNVDSAIFARPHVVDEDTVAFIMGDHLSHSNVESNPHAAYLFLEQGQGTGGEGYNGLRLYLTKTGEETDPKKIEAMRRKERKEESYGGKKKFLVQFKVDQARRLVGD